MSVIQQIQDKYAKLMAVIIALALVIFVVMLAFENGGNMFQSNSTSIGKVNGTTIDGIAFQKKLEQQQQMMEAQGYGNSAAMRQQAMESAWNQEVAGILLKNEINKLGFRVGKKEIGDIFYGKNPPQDLAQQFTDPQTGIYNAALAKQQIDGMLKKGTADQKAQFSNYIDQVELARLGDKYNSLLVNSINFPRWLVEKQNADNSQIATVSLVRDFYTSIPDSTVQVSDKEINDFIADRKKEFEQPESRSITYVAFSALPTAADSIATKQRLQDLKPAFDTATAIKQFLLTQGVQNFYDGYISGNRIQIAAKDSIFHTPVNAVYGPYLDGGSYALSKMLGSRVQPDTVTIRHILVATTQIDPQTRQAMPVRADTTAKRIADSVQTVIRNGANFDSVCAKVSDDPGSKDKGGKYENVPSGQMTPEFNDYIFSAGVGAKGIVKTDFGYHYIEVLSQKGASPAYKVAHLIQPIEASAETDAAASNKANLFSGDSRNQESFDANAEKLKTQGIQKAFATDITPNAAMVMGLGESRPFVKAIYAAKLGEVLTPERVGDQYVVAMVTEINEKGTMPAAKARQFVEPVLRNQKKAELIKKKIGPITTLEAAAAKLGGKQVEIADSVRMNGTQSPLVASEPKVIGAAFNPANKGKVVTEAIPGTSGVYVIRVDNVAATPSLSSNVAEERKMRYEQTKQRGYNPLQALMQAADIKDNRSKIF